MLTDEITQVSCQKVFTIARLMSSTNDSARAKQNKFVLIDMIETRRITNDLHFVIQEL